MTNRHTPVLGDPFRAVRALYGQPNAEERAGAIQHLVYELDRHGNTIVCHRNARGPVNVDAVESVLRYCERTDLRPSCLVVGCGSGMLEYDDREDLRTVDGKLCNAQIRHVVWSSLAGAARNEVTFKDHVTRLRSHGTRLHVADVGEVDLRSWDHMRAGTAQWRAVERFIRQS